MPPRRRFPRPPKVIRQKKYHREVISDATPPIGHVVSGMALAAHLEELLPIFTEHARGDDWDLVLGNIDAHRQGKQRKSVAGLRGRLNAANQRAKRDQADAAALYDAVGNAMTINQAATVYEEFSTRAAMHATAALVSGSLDDVAEAGACWAAAESAREHLGCGFGATRSYAQQMYHDSRGSLRRHLQ